MNAENTTYFDSFGGEHILKEPKKSSKIKRFINTYRIQAYNSRMFGYFCCWIY